MAQRLKLTLTGWFVVLGSLLSWLSLSRFHSFHNVTFDLAFYTRIAWGIVRFQFWEPIVGAHVLGLHVCPVLLPFGLLGAVFGRLPELLLIGQALTLAATIVPLSRIGQRHLGPAGSLLGPALFTLHPTVSHVGSYEFHPSTLAVLPLAWMIDAMETKANRVFLISGLALLLCREDLAVLALIGAALYFRGATQRSERRASRWVGLVSLAWFVVFIFLQRLKAPPVDSIDLHFGRWGDGPRDAILSMLVQPMEVLSELLRGRNLDYLFLLFGSLGFLPLLSPRLLLLVAPILAANLISDWPTTTELSSHYSALLVPVLIGAALQGAGKVRQQLGVPLLVGGMLAGSVASHAMHGQSPLSVSFDWAAFRQDARSRSAAAMVEQVPEGVSVQAPYALLPHLAQRLLLAPAPPPDRNHDLVILEAPHRQRFLQRETLLRTEEEPVVRSWLAKEDLQLTAVAPPYLLLTRGRPARESPLFEPFFRTSSDRIGTMPEAPLILTDCLSLVGWVLSSGHPARPNAGYQLALALDAEQACPADLALRIGRRVRPRRTDLLFDGLLNPALLRHRDQLWSYHPLTDAEATALREGRLRVGLIRESGARPRKEDPVSVPLR